MTQAEFTVGTLVICPAPATGKTINGILTLNGSSGADTLIGSAGNDILNGKGGADIIQAGDGNAQDDPRDDVFPVGSQVGEQPPHQPAVVRFTEYFFFLRG